MAYQLDVQSSLVDVHSRFISRIFQFQDYKSYNNPTTIQNYILRKKNSGKIDDKISLRYSNRNGHLQNYHLRLVTFFLKEGIDHVALQFIQNNCLIKLIDVKYGFNTNNSDIQILLLKFIDQFNLWSTFSPQIERLLSQLQPYNLFQLINTYPAINNHGIRFQNPQFALYLLNNVNSQLKALQYSQFQTQINHQLSLLQQQFQQLSDKETRLIQKEQQLQLSRPPLSSYPIRPSFTSASNDNSPRQTLDTQTETKTDLFNHNPFNISLNITSNIQNTPSSPKISNPRTPLLPHSSTTLPQQSYQPSPHSQQPSPHSKHSSPHSKHSSPHSKQSSPHSKQSSPHSKQPSPQSQFLFTFLQNQLNSYFDPNSNKTSKTKITKEVKLFLKQKTIQKNLIFQQYIDSHSNSLNSEQYKLLQKWFDTKLSS